MNILIIEDDVQDANLFGVAMRGEGYSTDTVNNGEKAMDNVTKKTYDLILLDVSLPGKDGFAVCRQFRAMGVTAPILLITGRDDDDDKVEGLDSGADDYVVKPCSLKELLARVRALTRRHVAVSLPRLEAGCLILDPVSRKATRSGKVISLSTTEYNLLDFLMKNAGRTLTRNEILLNVWQYDFDGNDNVLDVYISYLRNKIDRGTVEQIIQTIRGVGFRLRDDVQE